MPKLPLIALFLIAGWATNTWATGTNVYKCGSTYSQTPCEAAVPVRVDDDRSPAQKSQADAIAQQQARTADAMEKTRVKEDSLARTEAVKLHQAQAKAKAKAEITPKKSAQVAQDTENSVVLSAPAGKRKSKKAPEYFTAKAAQTPRTPASAAHK